MHGMESVATVESVMTEARERGIFSVSINPAICYLLVDVVFNRRDNLIECSDCLTSSDLAGVLVVIFEILIGHHSILVTDEPVAVHLLRIECDLNLCVVRHRIELRVLVYEHLHHLKLRVDILVCSVALVGDGLHHAIIEVAASESTNSEIDSLVCVVLNHFQKRIS